MTPTCSRSVRQVESRATISCNTIAVCDFFILNCSNESKMFVLFLFVYTIKKL